MTSNSVSGDKYMTSKEVAGDEWITLKAASKMTGRSINSLRILIGRKKIDMVKKVRENGPGYWIIHRSALEAISRGEMVDEVSCQSNVSTACQSNISPTCQMVAIPAEVYERQQKEHDNMMQGLMMYRFKFEEAERQLKLLPAPVEAVTLKLEELERTVSEQAVRLQEEQKSRAQVEVELQRERSLPWWKKLLGVKK